MTTKEYLQRLGIPDMPVSPGFHLSDLIQLYHDHQHAEKLLDGLKQIVQE